MWEKGRTRQEGSNREGGRGRANLTVWVAVIVCGRQAGFLREKGEDFFPVWAVLCCAGECVWK